MYYESHYSEVSRPPVIGGSDPPPTITSAAGSNAGSRPSGGFKEKKQHGVKRMSTKRLEKSKAVEMDYENDVAPVATAGMLIIFFSKHSFSTFMKQRLEGGICLMRNDFISSEVVLCKNVARCYSSELFR